MFLDVSDRYFLRLGSSKCVMFPCVISMHPCYSSSPGVAADGEREASTHAVAT